MKFNSQFPSKFSSYQCASEIRGIRGPVTCFASQSRTSKSSHWCLAKQTVPSLTQLRSYDEAAGSKEAAHPVLTAIPRAPVSNEPVTTHILRTRECSWSEALCDHNHTTVAGSQSCVQARQCSRDCRSMNLRQMLRRAQ